MIAHASAGGLRVRKYHALGNDYLVAVDGVSLSPAHVRALCNRHAGLGADGVLLPGRDPLQVTIFNPDGSVAESSGNGARIYARFLYDEKHVQDGTFALTTSAGRSLRARVSDGGARVEVAMGVAQLLDPAPLPFAPLPEAWRLQRVNMGNPHAVVFGDAPNPALCEAWGPRIENDARFPGRTNVQFVQVVARDMVRIEIWERGAGRTLASGSSACAVQAACFAAGFTDAAVTVAMPGGSLQVRVDAEGAMTQAGPVVRVYDAHVALSAASEPL